MFCYDTPKIPYPQLRSLQKYSIRFIFLWIIGHDNFGGGGGYANWANHDHYQPHGQHGGNFPHVGGGGGNLQGRLGGNDISLNTDLQTQPQMLTLKQFLATQDDSISDSDAITKYNEYKLEFKRQQLNEFFVAHKDEEW